MDRLCELISPDNSSTSISAAGDDWWLEVGTVDLDGCIVTIQRDQCLIAAIQPRDDGRLKIAAFWPLDGKSASYLTSLSKVPHPTHGVCMRENNWEYALDCSAANGNFYAANRGEAYLSYWESGLGVSNDGSLLQDWYNQRITPSRRPAKVVTELGVYYTQYDEDN